MQDLLVGETVEVYKHKTVGELLSSSTEYVPTGEIGKIMTPVIVMNNNPYVIVEIDGELQSKCVTTLRRVIFGEQ